MITSCNHRYHVSCILLNVQYNGFCCPYCRTRLSEEIQTDSEGSEGEGEGPEGEGPEGPEGEGEGPEGESPEGANRADEVPENKDYITLSKMHEAYCGIYGTKVVVTIILSFYLLQKTPAYKVLYYIWGVYHVLNLLSLVIVIWIEYNRADKSVVSEMFQNQTAKLQYIDNYAGTLYILHIIRMNL